MFTDTLNLLLVNQMT